MSSATYLGIVDSPLRHRGIVPVVSIRPLLVASEDGSAWERGLNDVERREEFPNRGLVSWLTPDPAMRSGTYWQFQIDEQPTFDPGDAHHERFKVARNSIQPVFEVIDSERFGGAERAREMLTVEGVSSLHEGTDYYLRVNANLWALIRLVRKNANSPLLIDLDLDGMLRLVEWDEPVDATACLGDPQKLFFPPGIKPQGRQRLRDWSPDSVVFARVLKNLRRRDRKFADSLSLSEKAIAQVAAALSSGDNSQDPGLETDRLARAQRFVKTLQDGRDATAAVEAVLTESPIADQIAARMELMLEEERKAAKSTIQSQLGKEQQDLDGVRGDILKAQKELETLRRGTADLRSSQESMVANLEQHLAERVAEAINEPVELLGQVALIRAVSNRQSGNVGSIRPSGPMIAGTQSDQEHTSIGGLSDVVRTALAQRNIAPELFRSLHASFIAGTVPLIVGARAHELLTTYAMCVASGSLCWIPVSAGWIEPGDFLGRVDPVTGTFASHPCGLLELLLFAQSDSRLHLVVFDGIDRALMESFFMPVIACHADSGTTIPRALPVCGSQSGLNDILKGQRGRITWPSNVLLAATITPDSEISSIPGDLWNHSPLILADAVDGGPTARVFADMHPGKRTIKEAVVTSFVSLSNWLGWQTASREEDLTECIRLWDETASQRNLPKSARDLALRYFSAAKELSNVEGALGDIVAHCILPHLLFDADAVSDILQQKQTVYGDGSMLKDTLKRLTSRGQQ